MTMIIKCIDKPMMSNTCLNTTLLSIEKNVIFVRAQIILIWDCVQTRFVHRKCIDILKAYAKC